MEILMTPPQAPGGCVLAVGVFDGVHPGHRVLLARAKGIAVSLGAPLTVFTFDNMPQKGGCIFPFSYNAKLLCECGVDFVYRADFEQIRRLDAETFARDTVAGGFAARAAVCGGDFRFGFGREGTPELLSKYVPLVVTVPEFRKNGVAVSSTLIREKLRQGDIPAANALLGREYSFCFETVRGAQLGTKLGFPTANQIFPEGMCIPRYGVYAGRCSVGGKEYECVLDIGVKPTVCENALPGCETHIFGAADITYGDELRVFPQIFLRPERRFGGAAELAAAVERDVEKAKLIYARKMRSFTKKELQK